MILNSFFDFNSKNFLEIGNFKIAWYAVCILTGIIIAFILGIKEAKRFGISPNLITDGLIICVPIAILACRIYYVIFHPEGIIVEGDFFTSFKQLLGIYDSGFELAGLSILGGIISATIFVIIYCKIRKMPMLAVFDFLAVGLLCGQIAGRWGNFFNQEAHGGPMSAEAFEVLSKIIPTFIMDKMYFFDDGMLTYWHPTFLYEGLWNTACLVTLLILRRKAKKLQVGDCLSIYLMAYGIGRGLLIEPFRTDPLMLGDIRINVVVPLILTVIGLVWFLLKRFSKLFRAPYYIQTQKEVALKHIDGVIFKLENTLVSKNGEPLLKWKDLIKDLYSNNYKLAVYSKNNVNFVEAALEKAKIRKYVSLYFEDTTDIKSVINKVNAKNTLVITGSINDIKEINKAKAKSCLLTSQKGLEFNENEKPMYQASKTEEIANIIII